MIRAVFLDRDGVLNSLVRRDGRGFAPRSTSELFITHDARAAVQLLQDSGFICIVVTNQPDISRGHMTTKDLTSIHDVLSSELGICQFYVCPHDASDKCSCRKPRPGLITSAAAELKIDLASSWLIGDRVSDLQAGISAGCHVVFLAGGQDSHDEVLQAGLEAVPCLSSLTTVANFITTNQYR